GSLAPGEADELALLADLLGDPSTWTDPPAGLEDAIVQRVEEAPRPSEHGSAPASTSATQPVAERARPRRRRVAWLAAPAAAAIAAVIAVAALTGPSTSADFSATLTATAAAPSARATARITKTPAGFRVVLDAHGLPTLPPGEFYQAWLKKQQT